MRKDRRCFLLSSLRLRVTGVYSWDGKVVRTICWLCR